MHMNTNYYNNDKEKLSFPANKSSDNKNKEKLKGWKKWFWILISIVMGIYIFIPEFTDTIPFLGWIDEGIAIFIFTYALNKLGLKIPVLDKIINKKINRNKT